MRISNILIGALLMVVSNFGSAQMRLVNIDVPVGFEGPVVGASQGANVEAYVKKIPGQDRGTLIQVTTYDFGNQLEGLPPDSRGEAAEYYLSQFLSGVQRQKESFNASHITRVTQDKFPAARAEWDGSSIGFKMSGVMYCVVVGTVVISLHTQSFEDSPESDKKAALAAIESVTFNENK